MSFSRLQRIASLRQNRSRSIFCTALLFYSAISGCGHRQKTPTSAAYPSRIISLAPSITETLFAIGAGDRVVGVTRFCQYPPETKNLAHVGGYTDPNYEAILSLYPDIVILLKEHEPVIKFLSANNIRYLTIDNHNIAGIIASIDTLGKLCNVSAAADSICALLRDGVRKPAVTKKQCPRMLVCVGRDGPGSGSIGEVWAAGKTSIYDEIMEACGVRNIIADSSFDYPTLTAEAIIRMKPDIIVEIANYMAPQTDIDKLKKDWMKLDMVPAVRDGMIFFLTGDYVTIPGPRTLMLVEDMRRIVQEYVGRKSG